MRLLALPVLASLFINSIASATVVTCGSYYSTSQHMCVGAPSMLNVDIPNEDPGFTTAFILNLTIENKQTDKIENMSPSGSAVFNHDSTMHIMDQIELSVDVGGAPFSLVLTPAGQNISGDAVNRARSYDGTLDYGGGSGDIVTVNNGAESIATYSAYISDPNMVALLQTSLSATLSFSCCSSLTLFGNGNLVMNAKADMDVEAQLIRVGK